MLSASYRRHYAQITSCSWPSSTYDIGFCLTDVNTRRLLAVTGLHRLMPLVSVLLRQYAQATSCYWPSSTYAIGFCLTDVNTRRLLAVIGLHRLMTLVSVLLT